MYQNLSQFKLSPGARGRSAVIVILWSWLVQPTLFAMSPQFMFGWRRFLLRLFGADIGNNVLVRPSVKITYPWKVSIGDNSWVGDHATLYSLGDIAIGKNAVVSQLSYLCTGTHDFNKVSFDQTTKPITIEDEAWVATDVFIYPGLTVGKGAIVGARSTVTKDIPAGSICVGNPAVKIRDR